MTSGRVLKGYSEGMAFWTSVEGQLADGAKLRLYIAAFRGRIWRVIMSDSRKPVSEGDAVRLFGTIDDWESWPLGTGSGLLDAAAIQFEEYFSGRLLDFDLPLEFDGTVFQQTVWRALTKIPYGETRTYGDIAETVGKPTATRAVGSANGRNNLPIIVPCHRVIGAGGKLCGFGGGIELKKSLLYHEAAVLKKRSSPSE
jgi:O-6-methylguanine DNA methyltransferase